jgi:hydrogenase maturation protease
MLNKKKLVLGIGNNILTDDGIGWRLVHDLIKLISDDEVKFDSACCGGLELVEYIKDYMQVVLIDAIRTKEGIPGDVYWFIPADLKETSHLSNLHDVSFLTALKLYDNLNLGLPNDIHIIAVEIVEDMEFSEEFSFQLRERYPEILENVLGIVKKIIAQKDVFC